MKGRKCATCGVGESNHVVQIQWGRIPMCQSCAETHASYMARELKEQGPKPLEVEFFVTHEFHGLTRTAKCHDLEHALTDFVLQAEFAVGCTMRDHLTRITAVHGNQRVIIKEERY